ncbi:FeoA domain-containing protein [Methanolobus sp.]|nr:FeoA domain-containing protein [Methanolobus sp.]
MGLTPGTRVEVIRRAPLGDPVEFKLKGYNLSLRKKEAETILVELVE